MDVSRYLCLMFTIGLLGSVRPDLDCNSASSVYAAQSKCFSDQRLETPRPYHSTGDKMGQMHASFLKQMPESVCKNPASFRRVLACLGDIVKGCMLTPISPSTTLPQIVDKLCINDKNVNLACAASKYSDAMQCEMKISFSSNAFGPEDFCKKYKFQNDCQRSQYYSCGCATVRAYETIYLDIFYQAVCPQSLHSISRVQCDGKDSSIFLNKPSFFLNTTSIFTNKPSTSRNKGVGASGGMSVLTLSLLLVAAFVCYSIMF